MKTKKIKIITLLVILSMCFIIFKLHTFGTSISLCFSRDIYYDTVEETE